MKSNVVTARQLQLAGRVQGHGIRPAISRLAMQHQLAGHAANTSDGVRIHAEGRLSDIDAFINDVRNLTRTRPDMSLADVSETAVTGCPGFEILVTGLAQYSQGPAVEVPPDLAVCADCIQELQNPADHRYGYALTSCTACGPRYSIIDVLPFERTSTSMTAFPMCERCDEEYHNPANRRFLAQTTACPQCGPQVWFESPGTSELCAGPDALNAAAQLIVKGGILAMKGIGGYQLICDATNETAVHDLRTRKQRKSRPLAVMVLTAAETGCLLPECERAAVTSEKNPIVILDQNGIQQLAASIHPGINSTGIFLPATPLHTLLVMAVGRPLVVTSGNLESSPMVFETSVARAELHGLADGWLHHNRPIRRPIDDSVVRIIAGQPVTIRAGRGIAPLRLAFQTSTTILATGGQQKSACALSNGRQVILGPHIGDLTSMAMRHHFIEQVRELQSLYRTTPEVIAHDLHPDYFTSQWAAEQGCQTIAVQHHHAHIVSGMLEHGLLNKKVLGAAFDGSGYGTDGTIWGGEFLLTTTTGIQRVASLLPYVLPGGDMAVREPWRIAVSLLTSAFPNASAEQIADWLSVSRSTVGSISGDRSAAAQNRLTVQQIHAVQQIVRTESGPRTSSLGRLFDGVAALILGLRTSGFEGEPALQLESCCSTDSYLPAGSILPLPEIGSSAEHGEIDGSRLPGQAERLLDWRPFIRKAVVSLNDNSSPAELAVQFHRSVAVTVRMMADQFPEFPVVLSGGCFQNRVLTEYVVEAFSDQPERLNRPGIIPPNDGGLAVGQLVVAAAILNRS
jgi:hydrogenase maturation protein HypF